VYAVGEELLARAALTHEQDAAVNGGDPLCHLLRLDEGRAPAQYAFEGVVGPVRRHIVLLILRERLLQLLDSVRQRPDRLYLVKNHLPHGAYHLAVLDNGKAGHDLFLPPYLLDPPYLGDTRFQYLQNAQVREEIGKGSSLGPPRLQAEKLLRRFVHERHVALAVDDNHAFVAIPQEDLEHFG